MNRLGVDALPTETLKMLDLGMRLLPVKAKDKHPLIAAWQKKATTDRELIDKWSREYPGCNWGIATGIESGVFVVDVDGDEGLASVRNWQNEHGESWAKTLLATTGKGRHLYYQFPPDVKIRNSAGQIAPGIDIRGEGGFVVAPGSVHPSGSIYRIKSELPIAEAEQWLLDLILKRLPKSETKAEGTAMTVVSAPSQVEVGEGGRNSTLTMLAGGMRRKAMAYESIAAGLLAENQKRCKPPLEKDEVLAIARSVSAYAPDYQPPMTEIGFKEAFVSEYGLDIRIVDGKEWQIWDQIQRGGRWKGDTTREIEDRAQRFLRVQASFAGDKRQAAGIASTYMVQNLVKLARSDRRIALTRDRFDSNPMVLNTPSGLIDFANNTCRETRREDYCSKITTVGPKSMPTPRWQSYLDRFHPEIERQRFLQRFFGYCLTGDTREQVLVFGYGPAKNGKSTCLSVIAWIMGEYATTPSMDAFISDDHHSRHPTDLAALVGARLAVAAETQEGRWWDEVKVKQCTGGDSITARFMRQDFFTFQPQFKLFFVGNHRPRIRTVDEAMRRRFLIVPFDVTLPDNERIKGFEELLKTEGPGILAWMIEGTKAWLNGELALDPHRGNTSVQVRPPGLLPPESVFAASREYMDAEDTPGQWFEECAQSKAESWTLIKLLYRSYTEWTKENGLNEWSNKRFSNWLSEQPGIRSEKRGGGLRGYRGIALKDPPM
jgi:putative DNA primase/helicase